MLLISQFKLIFSLKTLQSLCIWKCVIQLQDPLTTTDKVRVRPTLIYDFIVTTV